MIPERDRPVVGLVVFGVALAITIAFIAAVIHSYM